MKNESIRQYSGQITFIFQLSTELYSQQNVFYSVSMPCSLD